MRIRNLKNTNDILKNSEILLSNAQVHKGKFKTLFGNNNPIHLEIGMGKGKFLLELAQANPDINFIGLEKYDSIIARAIMKIEKFNLNNIFLIREDAANLLNLFENEIETIYLNFSDPWLKKRYNKRRLTHQKFLQLYDQVFEGEKRIKLKTDNIYFFEDSIIYLEEYGYQIMEKSYDLVEEKIINCKTEYEEKFSKKNIKINYLLAVKK